MPALILLPIGVAIVAAVLGRAPPEHPRRWASARLLVFAVALALASAGLAATQIDPTVPDGDVVKGLLVAAALAALAVAAFYTIGYFLRPGWLLAVVLAATAVPYFFLLFFGFLWVLDLVYC